MRPKSNTLIEPDSQPPQRNLDQSRATWTWEVVFLGLKIGTLTTIIIPFILFTWLMGQEPLQFFAVLVVWPILAVGNLVAVVNIVALIVLFLTKRPLKTRALLTGLLIMLVSIACLGWTIYTTYINTHP